MICGGTGAAAELLDAECSAVRVDNGCDVAAPSPRYAILCPYCDGRSCSECADSPRRGHLPIYRCPVSHLTPEFREYLRRRAWNERAGVPPYPGDFDDWPVRYLEFVEALEAEVSLIRRMEDEQRRAAAGG